MALAAARTASRRRARGPRTAAACRVPPTRHANMKSPSLCSRPTHVLDTARGERTIGQARAARPRASLARQGAEFLNVLLLGLGLRRTCRSEHGSPKMRRCTRSREPVVRPHTLAHHPHRARVWPPRTLQLIPRLPLVLGLDVQHARLGCGACAERRRLRRARVHLHQRRSAARRGGGGAASAPVLLSPSVACLYSA